MKIKHRALALILSAIMVLTFMPALAFAGEEENSIASSGYWDAYADEDEVYLSDGEARLEVRVYYEGYDSVEDRPVLNYEWYNPNGIEIGGGATNTVFSDGHYYCIVTDNEGGSETVYFDVYPEEERQSWWIYPQDDGEASLKDGEAILRVYVENESDSQPDLTFSWFDENGNQLDGSGKQITVTEIGRYTCYATDGVYDDSTTFDVTYGKYWRAQPGYVEKYFLPGDTIELKAGTAVEYDAYDEEGMDYPSFSYEWFKCEWDEDDYEETRTSIVQGTNQLEVSESGTYVCVITDNLGNKDEAEFYVIKRNTEGGWIAYAENDNEDVNLSEDGMATLNVIAEPLEGDLPDLSYVWYSEYNEEEPITGAITSQLTVNETGRYTCVVSDGEIEKEVNFWVDEYEEEYSDIEWDVECDEYQYYMTNGSAKITAVPEYWGEGVPTYTYQWYEETYDEEGDVHSVEIPGATGVSYIAKKEGYYSCEVTISVNGKKDKRWANAEVFRWWITNDDQSFPAAYGKPVTIKVTTNTSVGGMTYQWYKYIDNEEGSGWVKIEGATNASYVVENVIESDEYKCEVTANGMSQTAWYWVYVDTSNYKWSVTYPNAVASYTTHDGRKLTISFNDGDYTKNFPEQGDKITMTSGSNTDVYTFDEDEWGFLNESGEYLEFDYNLNTVDAASGKLNTYVYSEEITDHTARTITIKYETNMPLSVTVNTDVKSIKFEPSSISLYSENVKETIGGHEYYYIYYRYRYKDSRGYEDYDPFLAGDKLTVTYTNGTTRVFKYDPDDGFVYRNGDEWYFASPLFDNHQLKEGNNTLKIMYQGKSSSVNVFLDTPRLRAERAAAAAKAKAAAEAKAKEAARQGTSDKKIAKVKISKPSVGKKSVTVKWKKLSSKQIKKGKVKKYEIWVCPNKAFGPSDTIIKEVSKSKASGKVKVPKKGTYYVKVRAIKKVGGVKYVGKWSSRKKVKVKK